MDSLLLTALTYFADTSAAVVAMRDYVTPTIRTLAILAGVACAFFLVNGGYLYMTSTGKPDNLEQAKRVIKNALIGLVIVLGAVTITTLLTGAYGSETQTGRATLPSLEAIPPKAVDNGLIDVLINAVTGFLSNIIQAVAAPFLSALDYFTKETPLMAENKSVFNLWLAVVAITNILFILVLALIGFHVMSAASFGFDEIEIKHLLPRIGLVFLLLNSSIFAIDGLIELSNTLIAAINKVSGAASVWDTLTKVVDETGGLGLAALLVMLAFMIFSVILLVYYVGRYVTLFIGAVLSPLVILVWLVPGFRDFSETAIKTYLSTIFVLFVHVVILLLAASLFSGMANNEDSSMPDTLMAMIVGLATIMALLKTQGVMMQFSYVSGGARNARKLGGQFMNGVSYMSGKGRNIAGAAINHSATGAKGRAAPGTTAGKLHTSRQAIAYRTSKPHGGTSYVVQSSGTQTKPTTRTSKSPDVTSLKTPPVTATPRTSPKALNTRAPLPAKLPTNSSKDKTP